MEILAWIVSVPMLLIAVCLIYINWSVFVNNYIRKKPFVSAVTFGGGLFGGLGLMILPVEGSWIWCWVPCLIDWGSFPVVIVSIICAIKSCGKKKNTDVQSSI